MRHRYWFGSLLIFLGLSVHCDSKEHLRVCGELDPLTRRAFAHHHIATHRAGAVTFIKLNNKDKLVEVLSEILYSYQIERDTILNNIESVDKPLRRRRIVRFADDGTIASVDFVSFDKVDQEFRWVYDPAHPSAGKHGVKKGYVPMPNIRLESERRLLERVDRRLSFVRLLLQRLDPELLVPEKVNLKKADGGLSGLLEDFEELTYYHEDVDPVGWEVGPEPPLDPQFDLKPQKGGSKTCPPVKQSTVVGSGQASVAFALNALSGATLSDLDIDRVYGFKLLDALRTESHSCGYHWKDAGNVSEETKGLIQEKVSLGLPVIVALNGSEFSQNGNGTIVAIVDLQEDTVTYADPRDGTLRKTQWDQMVKAPSHPDGNFLFVPEPLD